MTFVPLLIRLSLAYTKNFMQNFDVAKHKDTSFLGSWQEIFNGEGAKKKQNRRWEES